MASRTLADCLIRCTRVVGNYYSRLCGEKVWKAVDALALALSAMAQK